VVGVNDGEVAVGAAAGLSGSVTGVPTGVPPVAHPAALSEGLQTKKLTVPDGDPTIGSPVTVAASVTDPPRVRVLADGTELVGLVAAKAASAADNTRTHANSATNAIRRRNVRRSPWVPQHDTAEAG
jgi:hypothetical protein